MAGVYTDQRLNLSKLGKAFGRKPGFQTGPGKSGCPGVRPVKKTGVFSRRQACRGKSQAPRSLDSRVAGKEQPTRPQSSGVQVPVPPIACRRAVSISDAREVTNRVLLGRKSPGCPAGAFAAVDTVITVKVF